MMTILLYGHLGRDFGKVHHYDVDSVSEAVRAMSATMDGFRKKVIAGGYYKVLIGGKDALSAEQLPNPTSQRESIRIVPVIAGAGKYGQIILGSVLIAAGWYIGLTGSPVLGSGLISIGMSMVLGGVAQLLFAPKPPGAPPDRPENRPSFTFDGAVNTAAQGNPVPVLYGKLIIGSQVASAGLSVEQI